MNELAEKSVTHRLSLISIDLGPAGSHHKDRQHESCTVSASSQSQGEREDHKACLELCLTIKLRGNSVFQKYSHFHPKIQKFLKISNKREYRVKLE